MEKKGYCHKCCPCFKLKGKQLAKVNVEAPEFNKVEWEAQPEDEVVHVDAAKLDSTCCEKLTKLKDIGLHMLSLAFALAGTFAGIIMLLVKLGENGITAATNWVSVVPVIAFPLGATAIHKTREIDHKKTALLKKWRFVVIAYDLWFFTMGFFLFLRGSWYQASPPNVYGTQDVDLLHTKIDGQLWIEECLQSSYLIKYHRHCAEIVKPRTLWPFWESEYRLQHGSGVGEWVSFNFKDDMRVVGFEYRTLDRETFQLSIKDFEVVDVSVQPTEVDDGPDHHPWTKIEMEPIISPTFRFTVIDCNNRVDCLNHTYVGLGLTKIMGYPNILWEAPTIVNAAYYVAELVIGLFMIIFVPFRVLWWKKLYDDVGKPPKCGEIE